MGVALGSVFSMVFMNLMALRIMRNRLGITWWSVRYKRLLMPLMASLTLALLAGAMNFMQGVWFLAMALAGTYVIFFLAYLLSGLSQEDKEIYSLLCVRLGLAKGKE